MPPELDTAVSFDRQKELAALARMIAFARQTALDLNLQLPSYCLGMVMNEVIEELKVAGADVSSISSNEEVAPLSMYH